MADTRPQPYNGPERIGQFLRRIGVSPEAAAQPPPPRRPSPTGVSPIEHSAYSTELPDDGCPQCRGVGFYDAITVPEGIEVDGKIVGSETVACDLCNRPEDTYRRLQRLAKLPAGTWTFAGYQAVNADAEKAREAVAAWVDDDARPCLFLFGTVGTGKTHLACAAAEALLQRGIPARFWTVPDLMASFGEAIGKDQQARSLGEVPPDGSYYHGIREELLNTGVLVLDDLGTQKATEFAEERLYEVVNGRYAARSRLIVTTNTAPAQMDGRIVDRLRDRARSVMVRMDWPSYRTTQGRQA